MPATSLSAWSFANHGPLTTVFTAPASCFTAPTQIQLASVTVIADTNMTTIVPYLGFCNTGMSYWAMPGDCVPSGREIESQYATVDTANPTAAFIIDYYSPGLYCPSGYVTVGVATNDAGTLTSSGNGFVPTVSYRVPGPTFNPVANVLLQGLDRGETAVLCCPSAFEVDIYGNCFSLLPSQPRPTEVCYSVVPSEDVIVITTTVSIFGTAVTDGVIQETNVVPVTETVTQTIRDTDSEVYSVITVAPMITLVHNAAEATVNASSPATSSPTSSTTSSVASSRAEISKLRVLLLSCWVISVTASICSSALF